jgi:CRP-like cAMP-binding protein
MSPEVRALFDLNFPELRWSERQWADAESRLRTRKLAAGATLFAQGDATPALFGVLAGCIEARFSGAQGQAQAQAASAASMSARILSGSSDGA